MSVYFLIKQDMSFWNTLYSNGRHWVIQCLQLITHLMKCWEMKETKWFHSWVLPDWSFSCQPPGVQFKFLLQTDNSSKGKIFSIRTGGISWTFGDCFTCTLCLVERKVTLIDHVSNKHSFFKYHLLSKGKNGMKE